MGPLNDAMKKELVEQQGDIKYRHRSGPRSANISTTSSKRGISPTSRRSSARRPCAMHEIGYADRPPTPPSSSACRRSCAQAMEEGALGVGSSLIYAPAFYAKTDELIALAKAAAPYGGMYISHMRSEGTGCSKRWTS